VSDLPPARGWRPRPVDSLMRPKDSGPRRASFGQRRAYAVLMQRQVEDADRLLAALPFPRQTAPLLDPDLDDDACFDVVVIRAKAAQVVREEQR
jgi:hypothetical protein